VRHAIQSGRRVAFESRAGKVSFKSTLEADIEDEAQNKRARLVSTVAKVLNKVLINFTQPGAYRHAEVVEAHRGSACC
jgi:hypothetical protein